MVTLYDSRHEYAYDFTTATVAYYNKYPNPYSKGVVSIDTISVKLNPLNQLCVDRLVHKQGSLPWWARAIIGSVTDSWILESSVVDPVSGTLRSWTRNINHRKILRVDDIATYSRNGRNTLVEHKVHFKSGLQLGIRERIETWSKDAFINRIKGSRMGMSHVMEQLLTKLKRSQHSLQS